MSGNDNFKIVLLELTHIEILERKTMRINSREPYFLQNQTTLLI